MGGSNLVNSWTQTELRVDLSQTWTKVQNIENSFNLASYLLISRGTPWVPETELHLWSHLQVFVMIIISFSYFECYSFFAIIITIFTLWMLFFCVDHDHCFHTLYAHPTIIFIAIIINITILWPTLKAQSLHRFKSDQFFCW